MNLLSHLIRSHMRNRVLHGCVGLVLLLTCSCSTREALIITNTIPAGSTIEYYAQIHTLEWQPTLVQKRILRPMPISEAEKWGLSAAQQRLGNHWKNYRFRVTTPGYPPIVWERPHQFP